MEAKEKTDKVLATFRCLIADLCHQFGCGHPGYVRPLNGRMRIHANVAADLLWEWQPLALLCGNT